MTSTRELLATLESAGLTLRLDGQRLLVSPADKLTAELREAIREQKALIVAELKWREESAMDRAIKNGWRPFDEDDVFVPVTLLTWGDGKGDPYWTVAYSTAALSAADGERARLRATRKHREKKRTKGGSALPFQPEAT